MPRATEKRELTPVQANAVHLEKDSAELTQEELAKVSGGRNCCAGAHYAQANLIAR